MNEPSTYFNTDDDNDDTQLNLFPPFSTVSHPFDLAEKEEKGAEVILCRCLL
jgi:hypothetical protein